MARVLYLIPELNATHGFELCQGQNPGILVEIVSNFALLVLGDFSIIKTNKQNKNTLLSFTFYKAIIFSTFTISRIGK